MKGFDRFAYEIRKTRIWLNEIGIRTTKEARIDQATGAILLPTIVPIGNESVRINFPINKLGRRYIKELSEHWLRGITCGTIKEEDVRMLFVPLAFSQVVYRYKNEIRRVTGLVRDKKLRKWIVWRRCECSRIQKGVKRGG